MNRLMISDVCPACGSKMKIVRLCCEQCHTILEGEFGFSPLAQLTPEHQRFVRLFMKARGSIKEVEKELGVSYPTVCKRLDEIIRVLGYEKKDSEKRRNEILQAVEKGEVPATQAAELLKQL